MKSPELEILETQEELARYTKLKIVDVQKLDTANPSQTIVIIYEGGVVYQFSFLSSFYNLVQNAKPGDTIYVETSHPNILSPEQLKGQPVKNIRLVSA